MQSPERADPPRGRRPPAAWRPAKAGPAALATALALAAIVASPIAGAAITASDVGTPERTAADRAFPASVLLENDGPARRVHLFGALYDPSAGDGSCGPATGPRFRAFTHVAQVTVEVPARSTLAYPPDGEKWLHRYAPEHAGATPEDAEFCVFVAEAGSGPAIRYESYATTTLSVRATNAPPKATFTVSPSEPIVSREARFGADGSDADGDPVSFAWDFGHFTAEGRAKAEGADVRHAFYPAGLFFVNLSASDGIDTVLVSERIRVVPAEEAPENGIPLGAPLAILALLLASRRR